MNLEKMLKKESNQVVLVSTYGNIVKRAIGIINSFKKALDCDIIIGVGCAFYGFFPIAISSIVAYFTNKPILYNFHDGQVIVFLEKYFWIVKFFIRNKYVVVATDYLKKAFQKYSFNSIQINNFFDFSSFPNMERKFDFWKRIIWARSFENIYQPELALKVALKVLEKKDYEFHFFGNGSLFSELYNKYKHPLIIYHNVVNRDELLKELSNAFILLNTTVYDNVPNIFFEAGYYKLLIVSNKVGGISTTFNDKEIIFTEENSVEAFYNLLIEIINNQKDYDIYRENLHKKILTFTWETVRGKWLKLLNNVVRQTR